MTTLSLFNLVVYPGQSPASLCMETKTYISRLIQVIVGDLYFLEGDDLFLPHGPSRWGIGMDV